MSVGGTEVVKSRLLRKAGAAAAVVAVSALLAMTSFVGIGIGDTATAAGTTSVSMGVGCKVSAGVKTLRLTPRATSNGDVFIFFMVLDVNGPPEEYNSGFIFTQSHTPAPIEVAGITPGVYPILLSVFTFDTVTMEVKQIDRTGTATITNSGCSVKTPA
jgi:hypothetical protein